MGKFDFDIDLDVEFFRFKPEKQKKQIEREEDDENHSNLKKKKKNLDPQDYEPILNAPGTLPKLELNSLTEKGVTPLRLAVSHKKIEIAKFLIEKGANVNSRDPMGSTPLHVSFINHILLYTLGKGI